MNRRHQFALDDNMIYIQNDLKNIVAETLSYFESCGLLERSDRTAIALQQLPDVQLAMAFAILKRRKDAWGGIIQYLNSSDHSSLAALLQSAADENPTFIHPLQAPMPSQLEEFLRCLSGYYLSSYSFVNSWHAESVSVEKVWVPLVIEESDTSGRRVGAQDILHKLLDSEAVNVALLKGDPGMGKTTFLKHVAFTWAQDFISNKKPLLYNVVLVVPLRSVGTSEDLGSFISMAVDFLLSTMQVEQFDRAGLISEIGSLKTAALICLDGLDEFQCDQGSIIADLFASPFSPMFSRASRTSAIPFCPNKIIITSRPYACNVLNKEFLCLRFQVCRLDGEHLHDFVSKYCQTTAAIERVLNYVKEDRHVANVPLLLSFACFLADSELKKLSSNRTGLYGWFIIKLLMREPMALGATNVPGSMEWRDRPTVKAAGKLAFEGCLSFKTTFDHDTFVRLGIPDSCISCGFLLVRLDVDTQERQYDFPHLTIQEYLAATHCFTSMISNNMPDDEWQRAVALLGKLDSHFGRFLFGIFSNAIEMKQLQSWMQPVLRDSPFVIYIPVESLALAFSNNLADCTAEDAREVGSFLRYVVQRYSDAVTCKRTVRLWERNFSLKRQQISKHLCEGLQLQPLDGKSHGSTQCFQIRSTPGIAAVLVVTGCPDECLKSRADPSELVIWRLSKMNPYDISYWTYLPTTKTLCIRPDIVCDHEVIFQLTYGSSVKVTGLLQTVSWTFNSQLLMQPETKQRFKDEKGDLPELFGLENETIVLAATVVQLKFKVKRMRNYKRILTALVNEYISILETQQIPQNAQSRCCIC